MKLNFSLRSVRTVGMMVICSVVALSSSAAQAQWVYAPPVGYAVPVATRVYTYRPVEVFSVPRVVAPIPVTVYSPAVVVPQAYVTYSNPVVVAPVAPRVSRERYHTGLFGGQVYDYRARGNGYGHMHVHTRDGWLGYHERGYYYGY